MIKRAKTIHTLLLLCIFSIIGNTRAYTAAALKNKKILLLYVCFDNILSSSKEGKQADRLRGSGVYKINLFNNLIKHGINTVMLIADDPELHQELTKNKLQTYSITSSFDRKLGKSNLTQNLYNQMLQICKKEHISIIHCNNLQELALAKQVAQQYPVKVIVTLHTDTLYTSKSLKNLDGVLGVGPQSMDPLKKANQLKALNIKHIDWIAPFFNEEKFLNFKPTCNKEAFFKNNFGFTPLNVPTICMIANFYPAFKNHTQLLYAAQELIQVRKKPIQLVFAGIGPKMQKIKKLAATLNITPYVHFLGHTTLTPELLFHSDIEVLISNKESFGIVLLEGALMRKPLIGSAGTGMEAVIKHGQTGLLCKVQKSHDIADQIERLLDSNSLATQLGDNAYSYVRNNYSINAGIEKLAHFYAKVL